jgi:hypothetical protein
MVIALHFNCNARVRQLQCSEWGHHTSG